MLTPAPTWPIHNTINTLLGQAPKHYRYYNPETKGLDYDGMCEDLNAAKDNSLVMFHVCAHNPTGVDPTDAQWEGILDIVKRKNIFCGFDSAY